MSFADTPTDIYLEVEDPEVTDNYGEPTLALSYLGSAMGDFQPLDSYESKKEFGSIRSGVAKVYYDPTFMDIPITKDCKIKINNEFYEVIGDPIFRGGFLPYIKVLLELEAKKDYNRILEIMTEP